MGLRADTYEKVTNISKMTLKACINVPQKWKGTCFLIVALTDRNLLPTVNVSGILFTTYSLESYHLKRLKFFS